MSYYMCANYGGLGINRYEVVNSSKSMPSLNILASASKENGPILKFLSF